MVHKATEENRATVMRFLELLFSFFHYNVSFGIAQKI